MGNSGAGEVRYADGCRSVFRVIDGYGQGFAPLAVEFEVRRPHGVWEGDEKLLCTV